MDEVVSMKIASDHKFGRRKYVFGFCFLNGVINVWINYKISKTTFSVTYDACVVSGMVWRETCLGPSRLQRPHGVPNTMCTNMAAGHRPVQQVKCFISRIYPIEYNLLKSTPLLSGLLHRKKVIFRKHNYIFLLLTCWGHLTLSWGTWCVLFCLAIRSIPIIYLLTVKTIAPVSLYYCLYETQHYLVLGKGYWSILIKSVALIVV